MLNDLDNFYLQKDEPVRSCLLALKELILLYDKDLTAEWKYRMPFFCYKGKMVCYLWIHKKNLLPYIGIVEGARVHHPDLFSEKRSRMKIMLVDPSKDLPVIAIHAVLMQALELYKTGVIKTNT